MMYAVGQKRLSIREVEMNLLQEEKVALGVVAGVVVVGGIATWFLTRSPKMPPEANQRDPATPRQR